MKNPEGRAILMQLIELWGRPPAPERSLSLGFMVPELVERGLLVRQYGGLVTTSDQADQLLEEVFEKGAEMVDEFRPCTLTLSHTRDWCGNNYCRES